MLLFYPLTVIVTALHSLPSTTSGQDLFPHAVCSSTGNFTDNSTYQAGLNTLLSSIATSNSLSLTYGFFNASTEVPPSQTLQVIGLCRGDLAADACRICLNTSASNIRQLCPFQKEAMVFNDNCTLRYSNRSILGVVQTDPDYQLLNVNNASNPTQFDQALQSLLDGLRGEAASGGSLRKYATGNTSSGFNTVYAMVQCTPDLSEQQCSDCLVTVFSRITSCCADKIGGRITAPSCSFRFETNSRFFDTPEPLPSPPAPAAASAPIPGKKSNTKKIVIIVVVSIVSVMLIICVLLSVRLKRRRYRRQTVEGETTEEISTVESLQFDLATIRAATDDFSSARKLGQGGFGAVYLGRLYNGQQIAVKRLSGNSCQGEAEFKNEAMLLARLQHRNLVRLLGFCLEGNERLLIYEFVLNSSLDKFIFDPDKRAHLDWDRRHRIIVGVARGLLYLHEDSRLRIIHRDLKASNILLDSDMNPKISDFGMARLFELDQTQAETNRIVGTYGYMAPEYAMHGSFSVKSDVFSFGVLVLEIISGQRNSLFRVGDDMEILISHVWKNWREGTIKNIIDPSITSAPINEILRCIHIGLLCVQENVASRPTMTSIVLMLNSHSVTLQVPSQPAFLSQSGTESDQSTTRDYDSRESEVDKGKDKSNQFSRNRASFTEPYAR